MPVINTNSAANSALRYLNNSSYTQSSSLSKLASGSRIIKASDDAAGLAIGTQLQSDVTVLSKLGNDLSAANTTMQAADGGEANISDILQRMKSLAAESSSETISQKERDDYVSVEFDKLKGEINSVAGGTKGFGVSLLDGSFKDTEIPTANGKKVTLSFGDFTAKGLGIDELNISSQEGAKAAIDTLGNALEHVTQSRASLGAMQSNLSFSQISFTTTDQGTAANSSMIDADVAAEKSNLAAADVKTQAAIAALSQANAMPQELLNLLR